MKSISTPPYSNQQQQGSKQTIHILLFGTETKTLAALRATLEVSGHTVVTEKTLGGVESQLCNKSVDAIFVSTDTGGGTTPEIFETISLVSPNLVVLGYATNPTPSDVINFIRSGGCDFFTLPEEYNCVNERIMQLITKQQEDLAAQHNTTNALQTIDKMEEENDALSQELANSHCETQKKIQQVALGAEFQTLVSQELDVESMLRTAFGYMLTRVGAMNAVVYLREGASDWGIGAYINYDRQPEQFQSSLDILGPAVCHHLSATEQIQHHKNGALFADNFGLDQEDYIGSEVVSYGCYSGKKCMATVVLFRNDSRPFDAEALDTLETLRCIFGHQLGTILKIHQRAESDWPKESYGDDDWSADRAA